MNCLYVCYIFPSLSETFIAREIQYLNQLGWKLKIFRLRSSEKLNNFSYKNRDITLSPKLINPILWFMGIIWMIRHHRKAATNLTKLVFSHKTTLSLKLKWIILLLSAFGAVYHIRKSHEKYDHIRASFLHHEAVFTYMLSTLLHIPYSLTAYTKAVRYPEAFMKKVVSEASFCIGTTTETVHLLQQLRNTPAGVHFIRTGIEINPKEVVKHPESSIPLLLAVGRLVPQKGFDLFIQAGKILANEGINYYSVIIGKGKEYRKLAALIKELDLESHFQLIGAVPYEGVQEYYHRADLLIMPSRVSQKGIDGLPTVIIEALSIGLPVVATSIAGIPDLVLPDQTGLLVPPENSKELALAIKKLLLQNELRKSMALQGGKYVRDNYDITQTIKKIHQAMVAELP